MCLGNTPGIGKVLTITELGAVAQSVSEAIAIAIVLGTCMYPFTRRLNWMLDYVYKTNVVKTVG